MTEQASFTLTPDDWEQLSTQHVAFVEAVMKSGDDIKGYVRVTRQDVGVYKFEFIPSEAK